MSGKGRCRLATIVFNCREKSIVPSFSFWPFRVYRTTGLRQRLDNLKKGGRKMGKRGMEGCSLIFQRQIGPCRSVHRLYGKYMLDWLDGPFLGFREVIDRYFGSSILITRFFVISEMQKEILVYCENKDLSLISLFNRRFIRLYINKNTA